jgi:enoyl-CoA hydratase
MASLVDVHHEDSIATITMDDGKVNVLSLAMLEALNTALDTAEADHETVVLAGREGRFCAGFDLAALRAGGPDAVAMLRGGFELSERLLSFPTPVVIVCTGHAVAMGVFLLLSGDYRVGGAGPYKVIANEVAIGLTMPDAAIEICRQRLTPAAFNRAVILAETFTIDDAAIAAGFLDRVVPETELHEAARTTATTLAALDRSAHAATKVRTRTQALQALRAAIDADF